MAARRVWVDFTLAISIMIFLRFLIGKCGFGDQSCQNLDHHRSLVVFQRSPHLGFRNGEVEEIQIALQDPAPCKPDGKPDLSGIWKSDAQNQKYVNDLAADFKSGEFPIQPWAEAPVR